MPDHDIRSYGARADGSLATAAIQAALDAAHAGGGGKVVVPAVAGHEPGQSGGFRTGSFSLRARVELHLEAGAQLHASTDPADYVPRQITNDYGTSSDAFLIHGDGCDGCALTGLGTIDGHGIDCMAGWRSPEGPFIREPGSFRPRLIGIYRSRNVTVRDLTLRDAAQWTLHLTGCEDVLIAGLRIRNRLDIPNCDGIDPDHCRNVRILGCHIEAGDDGIVLKNTRDFAALGPCENIVISGNTIVSTSAAIKIGTESHGDFRSIIVTGNVIRRSSRGLAIQLRDHGLIEDVLFSDCLIETRRFHHAWWGNAEPLYITARPRRAGTVLAGIRGVRCTNLRCHGEGGIFIAGTADAPIRDLVLRDIDHRIARTSRWPGGIRDYRPGAGTEHGDRITGVREAGLHLEHVHGVRLRDVTVAFASGSAPEGASAEPPAWYGPALRCESVRDLDEQGFRGHAAHVGEADREVS